MTTYVRKFTQFLQQNVAQPVGVTNGANSIGPTSGGGGATITYTFTQPVAVFPALYLGAAVRVDVSSGLWECCLATTPEGAEFYGCIINIAGDVYTVQFAGPVPAGTPFLTGLINGTPYYLSDTIAGGISAVPPAINGEVNLPVIWAMDNGNSVIKMSRGFVEGSIGGGGGGGGGGSDPNNVDTITQAGNTFGLGDVLYLLADQTFALAHARSFAASQAEWMVTEIVTAGSIFKIQQGGRVRGLVALDDVGAAIVSGPIYYLSPIIGQEGKLTSVEPTANGLYSKPFYVQYASSSNTGWLVDQRPLGAPVVPPTPPPGEVVAVPFTGTYVTTTSEWETVFCSIITPTSATHRIWILCDMAAGASGSGSPVYFRMIRNGIPVGVGDAAGNRLQCSGGVGHHFSGNPTNCFINYIDSPASILPVTYCIQIRSPSGAPGYVNRTNVDSNTGLFGRSSSSLTLIEVQP